MNEVKINQLFEIIGEQTVGLKLLEARLKTIMTELEVANKRINELKKQDAVDKTADDVIVGAEPVA